MDSHGFTFSRFGRAVLTMARNSRSYNFGDTFGDLVETDSLGGNATTVGPWCNQPDGIFEEDDAVLEQGGAA
jgi:hypothetical protein